MAKKKKSVLLLITIILTFITIALNVFVIIGLLANLFGMKDLYVQILQDMSNYVVDVDAEISFACFDTGLNVLIFTYFAIRLLKFYTRGTTSVEMGRAITNMSVWFLILTFSIPAVMTLITGIVMSSKVNRPTIAEATAIPNPNASSQDVSDYKLKAMGEAVRRLNELRQSGAISDEEYYANLDKILEG